MSGGGGAPREQVPRVLSVPAVEGRGFLEGELGAGKTTISRGILRGLGYQGIAASPTYTLLELYDLGSHRVVHLDLYRITAAQELEGLGFRDYLDGQTICLIEWPPNGVAFLPVPEFRIILEYA